MSWDIEIMNNVQYIMEDILILIICILGLIGNVFSIIVLSHREMRSPFNNLLLALTISDSLFLITQFIWFGPGSKVYIFQASGFVHSAAVDSIIREWNSKIIGANTFEFIRTSAQTASIYSTLCVSFERYVAVAYPLKAKAIFTSRRSLYTIIFILVISPVLSLGRFRFASDSKMWKVEAIKNLYFHYNLWFKTLFQFILPFFVLVSLNSMIYLKVRNQTKLRTGMTVSQSQKSEDSITKILLCVVLVFTFCYIPTLFMSILKVLVYFVASDPNVMEYFKILGIGQVDMYYFAFYVQKWENLTVSVNSSVNFIFYITVGRKFRAMTKKIWKSVLISCKCKKPEYQLCSPQTSTTLRQTESSV